MPARSGAIRLRGIGIDLIDLSRARLFFKEHRRQIFRRLLTMREQKEFSRKRFSSVEFSKRFTAKEAFFKALGKSWMGLEGFASMDVICLPHERFQVSLVNPEKGKRIQGSGSFFAADNYLGAQVVAWES